MHGRRRGARLAGAVQRQVAPDLRHAPARGRWPSGSSRPDGLRTVAVDRTFMETSRYAQHSEATHEARPSRIRPAVGAADRRRRLQPPRLRCHLDGHPRREPGHLQVGHLPPRAVQGRPAEARPGPCPGRARGHPGPARRHRPAPPMRGWSSCSARPSPCWWSGCRSSRCCCACAGTRTSSATPWNAGAPSTTRSPALISAARDEGSLRQDIDPRTVTRLLFGTINSIVEWYKPGGSLSPEKLADDVITMAFDGLHVPN